MMKLMCALMAVGAKGMRLARVVVVGFMAGGVLAQGSPASGGNSTNLIDGHYIHVFTMAGTFSFTPAKVVEVLVVGGGGGGAGDPGEAGITSTTTPGNGGNGRYFEQFASIAGYPSGWFGGGGNSYIGSTNKGLGGDGGGGNGGYGQPTVVTPQNGVANTGGGGGGGPHGTARAGGSGIVIVRYPAPAGTVFIIR